MLLDLAIAYHWFESHDQEVIPRWVEYIFAEMQASRMEQEEAIGAYKGAGCRASLAQAAAQVRRGGHWAPRRLALQGWCAWSAAVRLPASSLCDLSSALALYSECQLRLKEA